MKWNQIQFILILILLFTSAVACEAQKTAREKVNLQYNSDRQNKFRELEPADGTFSGTMHLLASAQDFDVTIDLKRISIVEKPQSQNPSETVEYPKLSGVMMFPALAHLDMQDYGNFQELLNPMGGFLKVSFDLGDFNPLSLNLILPYTVQGSNLGTFGELSGKLQNEHFIGDWFSNPIGRVGSFDLKKNSSIGTAK